MLGRDKIKECSEYDHLGLKNNNMGNNRVRITEKISKGRKTLNAASGLGVKPGGLTVKACSMLFWAMVIPTVTFASELWVMNDDDIKLLEDFQIYAGRRIQRFQQSSPRETSYTSLGWLRIEIFVYVKKLLFVRSIAVLDNDSIYKQIFVRRLEDFNDDEVKCCENVHMSPTFDIMRVAIIFGLELEVNRLMSGTASYSKTQWKKIVWSRAWEIEKPCLDRLSTLK